ncbi:MAG TPA: sigma-70 family RNA polymerase sigma factor [Polyangiales bacterium]|nr:sigma-70 family RNA polymerase sigma factor [Polyangiales bacterium]
MPLAPTVLTSADRGALYDEAVASWGKAIVRLARSYELDAHKREDLLQDIHLALWRSLALFDGACSLRTWVYRVAHNAAASHVIRDRRHAAKNFTTLDALDNSGARHHAVDGEHAATQNLLLDHVMTLVQRLNPIDRQVVLLYLEGLDAAEIGEVTGHSAGNVATKVHRIKKILGRQIAAGGVK